MRLFNIHKAFGTHLLPAAHTCFNQLDLPDYDSEDILREKLLLEKDRKDLDSLKVSKFEFWN